MKINTNFCLKFNFLFILFLSSLMLSSCGKKNTIYEIELHGVKSFLPVKHYPDEPFIKAETRTAQGLKALSFPTYQVRRFAHAQTTERLYVKKYNDGKENFNKLTIGAVYNYVILNKKMTFTKTNKTKLRDLYSKHVRLSEFNPYVRYAGEMWRDEDGIITVTNNSGSYKPKKEYGSNLVDLLTYNFPHIRFEFQAFK